MGKLEQPEALSARWNELTKDPSLQDLPYKIELNVWGKLEMSPASYRHGRLQGYLIAELANRLQSGSALGEVPILTDIGVRVPDVAWASATFIAAVGNASPLPRAPEICIEIVSPSNSEQEIEEKTRAYLAAGAREVWIVSEEGTVTYHDAQGARAMSNYLTGLSLPKHSQ